MELKDVLQHTLIDKLEKSGKIAAIGEVRTFAGKDYKKMGNGDWRPVVHSEETKLQELDTKKEKTPKQTLTEKLQEKTHVTQIEQHLHDLKNSPIVEGQQTKSGKPAFTDIDSALAAKYDANDFREMGNFYYDRAEKLANVITRMKDANQKVEPALEEIKTLNAKLGKQFLSQANNIVDRQAKTSKMTKSSIHMGYSDAAEINTSDFTLEQNAATDSGWLLKFQELMEGYKPGDEPRAITLDTGLLYLVQVEDGLYSGVYKIVSPTPEGVMEDTAKVRLERMTLPTLIQFCKAKEWIKPNFQKIEAPKVEQLAEKLENPSIPALVDSELDKKIKFLELIARLIN